MKSIHQKRGGPGRLFYHAFGQLTELGRWNNIAFALRPVWHGTPLFWSGRKTCSVAVSSKMPWLPRILPNIVAITAARPEQPLFTRLKCSESGPRGRHVATLLRTVGLHDHRPDRAGNDRPRPAACRLQHHQVGGMEEEGAWFETLRAKESRNKSANSLARSCKLVDQSCSS
jgi:hypothetical protein